MGSCWSDKPGTGLTVDPTALHSLASPSCMDQVCMLLGFAASQLAECAQRALLPSSGSPFHCAWTGCAEMPC